MSNIDVSVIMPVHNEEGNIAYLHKQVRSQLVKLNLSFEVIFVDDGSYDNSLKELQALRSVKIIRLNKRYGQSSALDAGIQYSTGRLIITLDGDGQNDPADFPILLNKLNEGYDAVCGWRKERPMSVIKSLFVNIGVFIRRLVFGDTIHDSSCTLRVYKGDLLRGIRIYEGFHRLIPLVLKQNGLLVAEVPVSYHLRSSGKSKYNLSKYILVLIDGLLILYLYKVLPNLFRILVFIFLYILCLVVLRLYTDPFIDLQLSFLFYVLVLNLLFIIGADQYCRYYPYYRIKEITLL